MKRICWLGLIGCAAALTLGAQSGQEPPWQPLFDGKLPINFRGYKMQGFPFNSWAARAGVISSVPGGEPRDLLIRQEFTNFEFSVEYRLAPGASSGLIYLVQEGPSKATQAGLKMVLADDAGNPAAKANPLYRSGALYALLPAKAAPLKPAGHWNEARLVVNTNHVEHWLNGEKVLEFDLQGEAFSNAVERSAFRNLPGFGEAGDGHLVLEHGGAGVWFRQPRVRWLPSPEKKDGPAPALPAN